MEPDLMFAPVCPKSRWKVFLVSWVSQAAIVIVVLALDIFVPQQVQHVKRYVVTNLVAPVEPMITQAQPVHRGLQIATKPSPSSPPLAIETRTKLLVPPKVKEPEVNPTAADIRLVSSAPPEFPKLPDPPLTKLVATNTFTTPTDMPPSAPKPAAEVQTGGFGDPNGISARSDQYATNIAAKGKRELPVGAGFGNGLGGVKGMAGVGIVGNGFKSSGFDTAAAPPRKTEIMALSAGAATPVEIIFKPKPMYTEEARRVKIEGEVRLEVRFTADGKVHVTKVLQGLGHGLDEQAVHCAEQIKFKPALHDGRPVDSAAVVHIIFELAA